MKMKCNISRQRIDLVLAPDQFSVAQLLGPEDLDRCVTRHLMEVCKCHPAV